MKMGKSVVRGRNGVVSGWVDGGRVLLTLKNIVQPRYVTLNSHASFFSVRQSGEGCFGMWLPSKEQKVCSKTQDVFSYSILSTKNQSRILTLHTVSC